MRKIHPAVRCLFILPAVLWFFAAVIVPVLMAVYYSFFSWDGVTAKVFIRFDNYRELFRDPVVWKSLTNSLKMAFWCVLLQLPIGMAFSVILFNRKLKGRGFFRTVYFLPVVLSSSMIAWWRSRRQQAASASSRAGWENSGRAVFPTASRTSFSMTCGGMFMPR